ncbi:MAG TPA: hypothetical protein IAA88_03380 [Candidatus Avimuribaculum pullicola]|nr:hypothetical protein [Candidatus Avimuribaculum pullicola]
MNDLNKPTKLLSRRSFFNKAANRVLPMPCAIMLAQFPAMAQHCYPIQSPTKTDCHD